MNKPTGKQGRFFDKHIAVCLLWLSPWSCDIYVDWISKMNKLFLQISACLRWRRYNLWKRESWGGGSQDRFFWQGILIAPNLIVNSILYCETMEENCRSYKTKMHLVSVLRDSGVFGCKILQYTTVLLLSQWDLLL